MRDLSNNMGTAILTNLNGMTNPPSDLNEITTGWKFALVSLTGATMTHTIPVGTQCHTNFNTILQENTLYTWPTEIAAYAIMRKKNFSSSSLSNGNLSNLYKAWPSNPTTDNILDQTEYPLYVYFSPKTDVYGIYTYETYEYNASGYRSHYSYQITIGMTNIITTTIWNKVERHNMDGHDWGGVSTTATTNKELVARPYTRPTGSIYLWYLPA